MALDDPTRPQYANHLKPGTEPPLAEIVGVHHPAYEEEEQEGRSWSHAKARHPEREVTEGWNTKRAEILETLATVLAREISGVPVET